MEHDQIAELERLLSETLTVQTEQDRRVAQLTDELALKSTLLERAETNAAEAKRIAELERRENRDRLLVQTSLVKQKDAELGRLQAKLDEFLQSHVQDVRALGQARSALQSRTADSDANAGKYERGKHACEQVGKYETDLAEVRAELGTEVRIGVCLFTAHGRRERSGQKQRCSDNVTQGSSYFMAK